MDITLSEKLEQILALYPTEKDRDLIHRAYLLAERAHAPQKRESGEPYIIHPVDAALTLAKMEMDSATIAAALLHDVVDDTPVTLKEIEKEFGKEIAFLVEGVSKLGKIKYRGVERHAENLRKMLVATAEDVRVILIKFADRLHNMETLNVLPERKQKRIALETLDIYAPIAARLGVAEMSKQLEDLAFPYLYPEEYDYIKNEANYRFKDTQQYLKKLKPVLRKELAKENIRPIKIEMRAKHYYSLWKKLEKYEHNWGQVYDLMAVRIIVEDVAECYKVLGIIHKIWKPLPGRIKDYIALPKPSGYQSLHTTVFCINGRITEIQIRTPEMHEQAEFGVAAHWRYKNSGKISNKKNLEKTYDWVKSLQEWKKETAPSEELLDNLKIDVFSDRIFVFTPNGDVIDLPQGATPVDFAYTIHSEIGDKCAGAICNGKIVPLSYELQNGDVVEIITSKNKTPSQAWLGFVKTRVARNRIRAWFKKQNYEKNKEAGEDLINHELKAIEGKDWSQLSDVKKKKVLRKLTYKNEEQLFAAVGRGDISPGRIVKNIAEPEGNEMPHVSPTTSKRSGGVMIAGVAGLQTHTAKCCNPVPPEKIAAYITVDKGASIHKVNCKNLYNPKDSEKILPAFWAGETSTTTMDIDIHASDRLGLLQDVSKAIAGLGVNIVSINTKTTEPGNVTIEAKLDINNLSQLKRVVEKLNSTDGVLKLERKN